MKWACPSRFLMRSLKLKSSCSAEETSTLCRLCAKSTAIISKQIRERARLRQSLEEGLRCHSRNMLHEQLTLFRAPLTSFLTVPSVSIVSEARVLALSQTLTLVGRRDALVPPARAMEGTIWWVNSLRRLMTLTIKYLLQRRQKLLKLSISPKLNSQIL